MTTVIQVPRDELLERITEETWPQGWGNFGDNGPTCLHGHIRRCDLKPGDEAIIRRVYHRRGEGSMSWNDRQANVEAVRTWIKFADLDITDRELADTFGPNWEPVVALVRRAAVLTSDEIERLDAGYDADHQAWDTAWDAVYAALVDSRRLPVLDTVRGVVWGFGPVPVDVASTLVVADLVGLHGLEQHHIDTLLGPWISVCGDPREVQP